MTPAERAKQLTEAHWNGYIKPLMEVHGENPENIAVIGFHYVTSGIHFYNHAIEDERNGMFTRIEVAMVDSGWDTAPHGLWTGPAIKDPPAASLCHSCHIPKCDKPLIERCEMEGVCAQYVPEAKQEAPTAAEQPLDFTLPSIALKCTAEEAMAKFISEVQEWNRTEEGSMAELIERWDCYHALRTFFERNGDAVYYQNNVRVVMDDLSRWFAEGRPVMQARRAMLIKNAARAMYSEEDNAAILATV